MPIGPDAAAPLSAVVPLRTSGRHYWDNALRISFLLASLARFAAPGTFAEITIVVPARELAAASQLAAIWPELAVRVVAEDALLPAVTAQKRFFRLRPWHFQQMIKLGACAGARTPLVMLFDPDVVATRPFGPGDLVADGRPVVHTEAKAVHRAWWQASGDLLGVMVDWAAPGLSVTPQLLRADLCGALLAHIEAMHGRAWAEALRDQSWRLWTEYTLYGLFCESRGIMASHHVSDVDRARRIMCRRSVWLADEYDEAVLRALFAGDDPGIFVVVQSAAGIPASRLADVFAPSFPLRPWRPRPPVGPVALRAARLAETLGGVLRKASHAVQWLRAARGWAR